MRVFDEKKDGDSKTKNTRKVLEGGHWYQGTIEEYEVKSFPTSRGTGYALKLKVVPEDKGYFSTTAFDFIGMDETGPYVNKGSNMEKWLLVIFKVPSLDKVILDQIKGKPLAFKVKNETRQWKDKKTDKMEDHLCADVIEVAPYGTADDDITSADFTPASTSQTKPAAAPAKSSETKPASAPAQPAAAVGAGKKGSKWDDDETL